MVLVLDFSRWQSPYFNGQWINKLDYTLGNAYGHFGFVANYLGNTGGSGLGYLTRAMADNYTEEG